MSELQLLDLVVRCDNTCNGCNTAPDVLEMEVCHGISLDDAERPLATVKIAGGKQGSGGLPPENSYNNTF